MERYICKPHIVKLLKLNNKKNRSNAVRKWTRHMNRHFTEKDICMANKHMKRWPASLLTRKIQIKSTMRYYYVSVTLAKM